MAHFFEAWPGMTKSNALDSSTNRGISSLNTSNGVATLGIWGGDGSGNWPSVKVYRGNNVVTDGTKPMVNQRVLLEDRAQWIRVIQLSGLAAGDEVYGMTVAGQRYTSAVTIRSAAGSPTDVMQDWANQLKLNSSYKPTQAGLCPIAVPYLGLKKGGNAASKLNERLIGGALAVVHGLAIHTTGQGGGRDAFGTAIWGCVDTWNKNFRDQQFIASAHFAISSYGDIVQIIPTNRIAWAQGSPGDERWISVEVDNNGKSPMNVAQLEAAKRLFRWVCSKHAIQPQLATATIFPRATAPWKKELDKITIEMCGPASGPISENPLVAAMSRGLSCHFWLDPRNGKPCPGPGMLRQLASIANPASVSI